MNHPSVKSTSPARRFYALLLKLYPSAFRREYGEELLFLFMDMHRAARYQGGSATLRLWAMVFIDLVASAVRERSKTMLTQRSANLISLFLVLPFLFLLTTAALHYEPPFATWFTEADGYTPTLQGRIAMILLLLSIPSALVINLLPRFRKGNTPIDTAILPFVPTRPHLILGGTILLLVLLLLAQQFFHELRPFVMPLGAATFAGQGFCLLGLLLFPMAFLLNRLPPSLQAKVAGNVSAPTYSLSLMVGATILLMVIGLVAIFGLETIACAGGVPNCD